MPTLRESLQDAARTAFCSATALPQGLYNLSRTGGSAAGLPNGPGGAIGDALYGGRALLCNAPPSDPTPTPPYTGGQCPNAQYSLNYTLQVFRLSDGSNVGSPSTGTTNSVFGPTRIEGNETGNVRFIGKLSPGGPDRVINIYGNSSGFAGRLSNMSITTLSGPNDCGDPSVDPPVYNPNDYTSNPTITFDDDDGNTITINPEFVIGEVNIDNSNNLNVPITVNFDPEFNYGIDINLSTGDINFGGGEPSGPSTPEDVEPVPDPDGNNGEQPTPAELEGFPIVAVFVKALITQPGNGITEIQQNGADNLVIPRLGSVTFKCALGRARGLAWTPDIDVRYEDCIIPCPIPWGARSVTFTPAPGVTGVFTPIRGVPLGEEPTN